MELRFHWTRKESVRILMCKLQESACSQYLLLLLKIFFCLAIEITCALISVGQPVIRPALPQKKNILQTNLRGGWASCNSIACIIPDVVKKLASNSHNIACATVKLWMRPMESPTVTIEILRYWFLFGIGKRYCFAALSIITLTFPMCFCRLRSFNEGYS